MKKLGFVLLLGMLASAATAKHLPTLTVFEVILSQTSLIGKRIVVRGKLSKCGPLSCGILGKDLAGRERYLSFGPSSKFDAKARKLHGRDIDVEVTVTDHCMPSVDFDIIVLCTDRPPTLVNPVIVKHH